MQLSQSSELLGMAISPVILISACGMLLLSMTNRLGRTIDHARQIHQENSATKERQVAIIFHRAKLIRAAILLISLCMVFTSVLIIVIFYSAIFELNALVPLVVLFTASLLCLVAALVYFIRDIYLSLNATKVELESS